MLPASASTFLLALVTTVIAAPVLSGKVDCRTHQVGQQVAVFVRGGTVPKSGGIAESLQPIPGKGARLLNAVLLFVVNGGRKLPPTAIRAKREPDRTATPRLSVLNTGRWNDHPGPAMRWRAIVRWGMPPARFAVRIKSAAGSVDTKADDWRDSPALRG